MSATTPAAATPAQNPVKKPTLALAFLGVLGAIQGSDPNIASTALVGAARGLDMGSTSLAASISTLALAYVGNLRGERLERFHRPLAPTRTADGLHEQRGSHHCQCAW